MPSVGFEPTTNGLCLPTTAFAASFKFAVWTFSSLYALPVKSLHLPQNSEAWLGITISFLAIQASPNLRSSTKMLLNNKLATQFSINHMKYFT